MRSTRRDGRPRKRAQAAALAAVVALAGGGLAGCGGGGSGGGGTTRTVLVDYSSDEFASFAFFDFPQKVKVRRGDTVEFKQTWTGEPHTVTGGTQVDETLRSGAAWVAFFESFERLAESGAPMPNPEEPGDSTLGDLAKAVHGASDAATRDEFVTSYAQLVALDIGLLPLDDASTQPFAEAVEVVEEKSDEVFAALPDAFDEEDQLAQNVGQPCYLEQGGPPEDPETPCAKDDQKQPVFDGRHSYYNSGVIPYEGTRSNTFRVEVASDAELGSYLFYCAIHGFSQRAEVEIVGAGEKIPDQSEVNRQIRDETAEFNEGLTKIYEDAEDDGKLKLPDLDETLQGPFAGLPGEEHTAINEFVPKLVTAKVGEPITWKMMGTDHSISFNVPKYFPIMEFLKDGTVRINPKLQPAAGGAIPFEHPEDDEGPGDGIVRHDGGTFDGTGFWSSGMIGAEPYLEYTMRISKPGTYSFACLVHPPMVGQVKIT